MAYWPLENEDINAVGMVTAILSVHLTKVSPWPLSFFIRLSLDDQNGLITTLRFHHSCRFLHFRKLVPDYHGVLKTPTLQHTTLRFGFSLTPTDNVGEKT